MLEAWNQAEHYRNLAEECRRLAISTLSGRMKKRYLLMARDYMLLADIVEQVHAHRAPVAENAKETGVSDLVGRFPAPWRIVEIAHGFAVDDATGQQLGVFYGRADPNTAGHTGILTIDEARQIAVDFARLPELLKQTPGRTDMGASPQKDKLARLETSRSPQGAPETSRLPRGAQVPTVTGLPSTEKPMTIPNSISLELDEVDV